MALNRRAALSVAGCSSGGSRAERSGPLQEGEASGAMSSLAMVGAAAVTAALAPMYVTILLRLCGYAA